jgi:hypothetical protein
MPFTSLKEATKICKWLRKTHGSNAEAFCQRMIGHFHTDSPDVVPKWEFLLRVLEGSSPGKYRDADRSPSMHFVVNTPTPYKPGVERKHNPVMERKPARFELLLPPQLSDEIDAWRRRQPDLPSRAEAARRLIELALTVVNAKEAAKAAPAAL